MAGAVSARAVNRMTKGSGDAQASASEYIRCAGRDRTRRRPKAVARGALYEYVGRRVASGTFGATRWEGIPWPRTASDRPIEAIESISGTFRQKIVGQFRRALPQGYEISFCERSILNVCGRLTRHHVAKCHGSDHRYPRPPIRRLL